MADTKCFLVYLHKRLIPKIYNTKCSGTFLTQNSSDSQDFKISDYVIVRYYTPVREHHIYCLRARAVNVLLQDMGL